eukprot:jgi/Chrzof1/14186/Cz08g28180.t1
MAPQIQEVTSAAQLQKMLESSMQTVAYFWASWCQPCKQMDVVTAALAEQHPSVTFVRVEAEEVDAITESCQVSTVPYFVLFNGKQEVDRLEGADPPMLTSKVAQLASTAAAAPATAKAAAPATTSNGLPSTAPSTSADTSAASSITSLLAAHAVVLFMKGSKETPYCGFSSKVVDVLYRLGYPFHTVDILQDEALREAVKQYSNWPTYPQLYVKSELIGGCDIVMEMHQSGELQQVMKEKLGPAPMDGQQQAAQQQQQQRAQHAVAETSTPAADLQSRLKSLVQSSPVMLFMKGTPDAPRCGFSRKVVEALRTGGVDFGSFDILQDEAVRQGLKELSNWPTYPQLFVQGELLGGCDIVLEMHNNKELKGAVEEMMHRGAGEAVTNLQSRLKSLVQSSPVMLFMKGTPDAPRCGFSRKVVEALRTDGLAFGSFDVLQDNEVRDGLKQYSNWPTYPQLYVQGELVGGCDIVLEMHNNKELKGAVEEMMRRL